jgi:hypothetical protein
MTRSNRCEGVRHGRCRGLPIRLRGPRGVPWQEYAMCKGQTELFFARKAERPQARERREAKANRSAPPAPCGFRVARSPARTTSTGTGAARTRRIATCSATPSRHRSASAPARPAAASAEPGPDHPLPGPTTGVRHTHRLRWPVWSSTAARRPAGASARAFVTMAASPVRRGRHRDVRVCRSVVIASSRSLWSPSRTAWWSTSGRRSSVCAGHGQAVGPRRVHGITRRSLRRAPRLDDVLAQLADRLDGAVFTAHNVAFDWAFVERAARRSGILLRHRPVCAPCGSRAGSTPIVSSRTA